MGKLIIFLKISTVTYLQLGLYTKKCKMILSYKYILCIPGDQAIHTIVKQFPLFPPPVQAILFNLFHTDDRWLHGFRKYKIQITEWEFYNTGFRRNIIKRIVDKTKQVFKLLSCSLLVSRRRGYVLQITVWSITSDIVWGCWLEDIWPDLLQ